MKRKLLSLSNQITEDQFTVENMKFKFISFTIILPYNPNQIKKFQDRKEELFFIPRTESNHLQFQREKTISIFICIETEDTLRSVFRAPVFSWRGETITLNKTITVVSM